MENFVTLALGGVIFYFVFKFAYAKYKEIQNRKKGGSPERTRPGKDEIK